MRNFPDHPDVERAMRTGYPDEPDEEYDQEAYEAYCDSVYERQREARLFGEV